MKKVLYEELLPEECVQRIQEMPVAYLPLGTLEWHGPHMPLGADGIQSKELFVRVAEKVGGVVLPMLFMGPDRVFYDRGTAFYGMDINTEGALNTYCVQQMKGSAYWMEKGQFQDNLRSIFAQLSRAGIRIVVGHGHGPSTNAFQELKEEAEEKHGKPVLRINPVRKNMITFARNIYVPQIEKSDEKIGFLMMDIDKTGMEKIIQTGEDRDVNAILILDSENNILVNGSNLSDDKCKTILKEPSGNYKIIRYNLQYDGCSLVGILDKNLLFKSVYKIFFKEMVMILAAISIIAIALFITAAKIAEQIQKFIVKLRQTTEINSNAYVEVDSNDEFRELANVYNAMLERIDLLIQQVYKQQLLMKDAQIESLQAQINPHFLYNTLDCINSLADMGKTTEVKKTVTSLGSIMRMSIKGAQFLKIEEELKYVNQYLYIQKMRFQEHIICLVEIPEQLYEYYIPKLMIQPLLENAIVHGVSELKETGMIAVTGKETEDAIYITVKDNGNGMPETIIRQLEEIRENGILKEKEHIGIFNIQQRLLLLYGKEYGLTVEHVKPSGTAVTICIPKTKGEKGYESGNYR